MNTDVDNAEVDVLRALSVAVELLYDGIIPETIGNISIGHRYGDTATRGRRYIISFGFFYRGKSEYTIHDDVCLVDADTYEAWDLAMYR